MDNETRIEAIVAQVESVRPHNHAGDMMLITKAELTDILRAHLAELFEYEAMYKGLCK